MQAPRADRVMAPRLCKQCHLHWSQSRLGLCRGCERKTGDTRTTAERERERVERLHPKIQRVQEQPREPRFVIAHGQEYEVMWP